VPKAAIAVAREAVAGAVSGRQATIAVIDTVTIKAPRFRDPQTVTYRLRMGQGFGKIRWIYHSPTSSLKGGKEGSCRLLPSLSPIAFFAYSARKSGPRLPPLLPSLLMDHTDIRSSHFFP